MKLCDQRGTGEPVGSRVAPERKAKQKIHKPRQVESACRGFVVYLGTVPALQVRVFSPPCKRAFLHKAKPQALQRLRLFWYLKPSLSDMKILAKIDQELLMFLSKFDLPPYGKAFAWGLVAIEFAVAAWIIAHAF